MSICAIGTGRINHTNALNREVNRYIKARALLEDLRKYDRYITYEEFKALRKQALEGDVMGATKKLGRIVLERRGY